MGLRPDPKCQHNKTRGACSACKQGKAPMQGTMRRGRLVSDVANGQQTRKRGWGAR